MRTLVERRERACFSILDGTSIDGVPGLPRPLKPPSDLRSFLGSYGSVGGFELMPVCAPHREQLSDKLMVNGYGRDYGKRLGHEPATTGTAMPTLIALTPEPLL